MRLECGTSEWFRKDDCEEPSIQGVHLKDLRYADETALLSTTPKGLEKRIKSVKEHSDEKGLFLNIKKNKNNGH